MLHQNRLLQLSGNKKQNALQPLYYKGFARHFSMKRTIYLNHQVFELFRYAYWGKDVNRFAK
ncbi:MAG: hypothetical protein H6Q69_1036 [Firmicutes bacterium]|nr:hypothetical protein [Bacillota bacterium]